MALWDIKGKALGLPVYDLLGGKLRDSIRLYANGWFFGCHTPEQYGAAAKATVEAGHQALKLDPYLEMQPFHTGYLDGQISAEGEELGCNIVQAGAGSRGRKGGNTDRRPRPLQRAHGHTVGQPPLRGVADRLVRGAGAPRKHRRPAAGPRARDPFHLRGRAPLHPLRLPAHPAAGAGRLPDAGRALDRGHHRAAQDRQHGRSLLRPHEPPQRHGAPCRSWPAPR